jgi:hypothetical protein
MQPIEMPHDLQVGRRYRPRQVYPDSMKFREKLLVFGGLMDSAGGHDSGRFSQRGGS